MSTVAANSLFTGLIESDFPVHIVKKFVVNNDEDWVHAEFHIRKRLSIGETLVIRISALIYFSDWTKDCKVVYFNCLLLILDHIAEAFCNGAPDHIKQTESLALADFKRVIGNFLFRRLWRRWVFDELQIQLGEAAIKEAWVVNTLLEECEFGDRRHNLRCTTNTINST